MHTLELSLAQHPAVPSPKRASTSSPRKPDVRLVAALSVLSISLALAACGGNKELVKGDNLALGASSIDMACAAGGGRAQNRRVEIVFSDADVKLPVR